jgi:predicted short-subunit dehydrogenase-like oxidoreductase (DUF2520 family)
MLPGMEAKPNIAIVGAGNLARALIRSLSRAGYRIDEVVARSRGRSLKRAESLAASVDARAVTISDARLRAELAWFCVPDSEILPASRSLARNTDWKNKIAFHSSGALSSDALELLRRRGAAVASVHPLMTFVRAESVPPSPVRSKSIFRDSNPLLTDVPFAIEGDAIAFRVARRIVKGLGGVPYAIRKKDKAAYHAWATFVSPLLTALLATAEHVADLAGVSAKDARRRMIPILRQTLENYAAFGAAAAFSGPIVRGDFETIGRHLQALRREAAALRVYVALAESAIRFLPAKNEKALLLMLQRKGRVPANRTR